MKKCETCKYMHTTSYPAYTQDMAHGGFIGKRMITVEYPPRIDHACTRYPKHEIILDPAEHFCGEHKERS